MDPNLRWCPSVSCMLYVRRPQKRQKVATCDCGEQVCLQCGARAHPGIRCANVGDKEIEAWIKDNGNVKYCPKCEVRTERVSGCAKMQCVKC